MVHPYTEDVIGTYFYENNNGETETVNSVRFVRR